MPDRRLQEFYEELKRRRVIRFATLYVIAFWPIVQVIDILTPALGLPDSIMKYLVFAFFGGLPFVLIFSWLFDLNREGIKRDDGEPHQAMFSNKSEFTFVATLLVLVLGLFLVQSNIDEAQNADATANFSESDATIRTYDSIAVLPFVSFSEEPRDQFFADGLTEELLNVLSRITDLRVAARTSSFAYKDVNKIVQLIGRELNVSTILEGSVRKNDVDDTIRVTAQLVDVETGGHLWSETYDKQFTDIFRIQDEISAAVAQQLKVTLKVGTQIAARSVSATPEAMIANSMGQTELEKRTEQGLRDAVRYFQQAITWDDGYALAYAGFADANTLLFNYGYEANPKVLARAKEAIDKALTLDPELGIAWASRGLLLSQTMSAQAEAKQALTKAMELNPSYAMAFVWYAGLLDDQDQQLKYYRQAVALDPRSAVAGYNVASILVAQGRDHEAMQMFGQIVEADPFYAKAYMLVGDINDRRGRLVEAIGQMEKSYDLQADPNVAEQIAKLYADVGDFSSSDNWIKRIEQDPKMRERELLWMKVYRYAAEGDTETIKPYFDQIMKLSVQTRTDAYLRTLVSYFAGNYASVIAAYEQSQGIAVGHSRDRWSKGLKQDAEIAAAFAYREMGQGEQSQRLTANLEQALNHQLEHPGRTDPGAWYRKALVSAIKDEEQSALNHLQRAIDEGWREHWKPGYEPVMHALRSKQPFRAMLAGLEARMNIIRKQFEMEAQFTSGWSGK